MATFSPDNIDKTRADLTSTWSCLEPGCHLHTAHWGLPGHSNTFNCRASIIPQPMQSFDPISTVLAQSTFYISTHATNHIPYRQLGNRSKGQCMCTTSLCCVGAALGSVCLQPPARHDPRRRTRASLHRCCRGAVRRLPRAVRAAGVPTRAVLR